jgi:hypothetical protein
MTGPAFHPVREGPARAPAHDRCCALIRHSRVAATGAPSMMGCPVRLACSAAYCDGVAGMAPKAIRRTCGHETHGMR